MLLLSCGSEEGGLAMSSSTEVLSTRDARHAQAPVLLGATTETNEPAVKKRKISIGMSRLGGGSGDTSGFEFPALSGKFTSSFIAQSLSK